MLDADGDGSSDVLLVAAPNFLGEGGRETGRVYVYGVGPVSGAGGPGGGDAGELGDAGGLGGRQWGWGNTEGRGAVTLGARRG